MNTIEEKQALQRAAALCSRRECCIKQIEEKLITWGQSGAARERILSKLTEEKFIDEARFARAFALDKLRYSHWGKMKIAQALRLQGIQSDVRDEALAELPEDEYSEIIQHLAQAKKSTIKASSEYERKAKLVRYLVAKGFEYDLINEFLDD